MKRIGLIINALLLILSPLSLPLWAEARDIVKFQLRTQGDNSRCILSSLPDGGTAGATEYDLQVGNCASPDVVYWRLSEEKQLIMEDSGGAEGQWCMSRRVAIDRLDTLYISRCLSGGDDFQLWDFDPQGALYKYTQAGGRAGAVQVAGLGLGGGHFDNLKGSFQWLHEIPPGTQWCYVVPWQKGCNRFCAEFIEAENCPPEEESDNTDSDLNSDPGTDTDTDTDTNTEDEDSTSGSDSGQGTSPLEPPKNPPQNDDDDNPGAPENPDTESDDNTSPSDSDIPPLNPESEQHSKKAQWFVLKQVRVDQNICLGFREVVVKDSHGLKVTVYRVGLEYCVPGRAHQEWGYDLVSKAVYNRALYDGEQEMCLTRTSTDILVSTCLDTRQRNSSQRWYFSRGWLKGVPWAALLSFTENNERWTFLLNNDIGAGTFSIRPKYLADCERVNDKCYDLTTGELKDIVPFYSN